MERTVYPDRTSRRHCDYRNSGGKTVVELDLGRLGLKPGFTAANWEKKDIAYKVDGSKITIPALKKNDFAVIVIKK